MSLKLHWTLAVKMDFAFKRIVLCSASLFQMCFASTVTIMYQKAVTGLALCQVFLQVNRFVISKKTAT